jgi:hypothetical protein
MTMIHRELTIKLPETAETLNEVLKFLLKYGLISKKEARAVEHEETANKPRKKNRWALAAEEMSKENFLDDGLGEELRNYIREFREGFAIKDSFDSKVNEGAR